MIELRKFEFAEGRMANYFDYPTYVDTIILNHIMVDGWPTFNDEYEKEFESFVLIASDFDLKFSLLQTETSTLGKTLEEFLTENIDNHCIAMKYDDGAEVRGGLLDIAATWFNKTYSEGRLDVTYSEGRLDVTITVFGFEKELHDYSDKQPFLAGTLASGFQSFLNECLFTDGGHQYMFMSATNLNWANTFIGTEPHIVKELWQALFQHNDPQTPDNRFADTTIWKLFKDACTFFGIVFKAQMMGLNNDRYVIHFVMYFRNATPDTEVTVESETLEHGFVNVKQKAKYQFFKMAGSYLYGDDVMFGILSDGTDHWYARGRYINAVTTPFRSIEHVEIYNGKFNIIDGNNQPQGYTEFDPADINIIEFSKYFDCYLYNDSGADPRQWVYSSNTFQEIIQHDNLSRKNYSFPAMWFRSGYTLTDYNGVVINWKVINWSDNPYGVMQLFMENTVEQSQFLFLKVLLRVFKLRLSYLSGFTFELFQKAVINGVEAVLYKLNNRNQPERKVESTWIEKY